MTLRIPPLLIAFAALVAPTIGAESWPQFRGPDGQGHAPEADVPLEWNNRKNVRWKVEVPGKAWSSPGVANGYGFVTTAVEDGNELSLRAQSFQLEDGSQAWDQEVFRMEVDRVHKKNSHASATPIVHENRLYVHFGHQGTACLDATTGEVLWTQTSLSYKPVHGNGGSPALFEDKLIFSCDGQENPFVVALNTRDGSIAWKTPREVEVQRTFSFSTPLLIEVSGRPQAVIPGSGAVISYDPRTGREIWRCRYGEGYSVVPRPVYYKGKIFVSSGFNRAILYAIRVDGTGDVTDTHIVWQEDKAVPKESSFLIVDDLLYFNDDKGILACLDPETGEEHYRERLDPQGGYSASPVYASGHLFFHNGDGVTTVIEPGERFRKVEENELREYGLSSFGVLPDGFLIRTEEHLYRIGE